MIRIITDSTCEAPDALMQHPAVSVLPLSVVFGQTALRDGIDISREEFWRRLPTANPLPSTSQATPGDFLALFKQYTAAGDEIITLTLSAKLSGTYDSAISARNTLPTAPIDVIDSRTISVGLGLMLQEAVTLVEAGASRDEIVARLIRMREQIRIYFVLETLEYLQRGGRIGKAQAFVGTLLKFKPLLAIVDGEVVPVTRVRSRAKALETLQETLLQQVPQRGPQVRLALTQAMAFEDAEAVGAKLAASFGTPQFYTASLGPVIGVHVGPGTVGAAVYSSGD
jgi:DegV family protein with EDD domain